MAQPLVDVSVDFKQVTTLLQRLSKGVRNTALPRALNLVGRKTNTAVVKRIAKESKLKSSFIRRKIKLIRAGRGGDTVKIQSFARDATNLIEWATPAEIRKFTQPRTTRKRKKRILKGVTARAWGSRKLYDQTFIVKGKRSGKPVVVSRKKGFRGSTGWSNTIYGPTVWREFNRYVEEEANKASRQFFVKELSRQINLLQR